MPRRGGNVNGAVCLFSTMFIIAGVSPFPVTYKNASNKDTKEKNKK